MTIRFRIYQNSSSETPDGIMRTVRFYAVADKNLYEQTPDAGIEFTRIDEDMAKEFIQSKEYIVTIESVETIEDKIKNPAKWFDWYAREPVSENVLRELLYTTKIKQNGR